MHYYIDGYNLLFRFLYSAKSLQEQRNAIIQDLVAKVTLLDLDATLVFDSSYQSGESTRSHKQHLEIIYTAEKESADDYILNCLKSKRERRQETVITSDQRLAWRARRLNAKTESIEDFIGWLNQRCKNKRKSEKQDQTIRIKKPIPPKEIKKEIRPGKTAEESHDYYLSAFEKKFAEEEVQAPPKKKTRPKPEPEPKLSDMERWQAIFEKNSQE
jgi:predicted RNA-binding protein with PIN domain